MIVKVHDIIGMQVICGSRGYSITHFKDRPVRGWKYELKDGYFRKVEFQDVLYEKAASYESKRA